MRLAALAFWGNGGAARPPYHFDRLRDVPLRAICWLSCGIWSCAALVTRRLSGFYLFGNDTFQTDTMPKTSYFASSLVVGR